LVNNRKYGHEEYRYAAPIAACLADHSHFRAWLLSKTKFADRIGTRVLIEEMESRRSKEAVWWRTNFRLCDCQGCSGGRETDIFAVLEDQNGERFGLHIEIKHPHDLFHPNQAERYPMRAACWVTKPSKTIVPHADATTLAIVDSTCVERFAEHLKHFDCVLTFDEINVLYPNTAALPRESRRLGKV
jgi:hypothetical protein